MSRALDVVAERACEPDATREHILAQLGELPFCYPDDLDQQQWEIILEAYGARPMAEGNRPALRFESSTTVWVSEAEQGTPGRAQPAHLTYSFPADGPTWGSAVVPNGTPGPNALNARFRAIFGSTNLDRGREYVRQGLAGWRRVSGLTYDEVADDNTEMTLDLPRNAARGDVRIGGRDFGTTGLNAFLAYNMYVYEGGDMVVNSSFFTATQLAKVDDDYRKLRNTLGHEHGHGLGYQHSVPCNNTKLMEPEISTSFDQLAIDDIRAAIRHYGDRFAGNNSAANAHDFGDLASPTVRSVIERTLGTNGASGYNDTNQDWFRFTLDSAQNVTIEVDPVGGSYSAGPQSFNCGGSSVAINADQAGDLSVELYDATGTSLMNSAAAGGPGATETLALGTLSAGTYTLRVVDIGPNPAANQIVQLYDLTVRVGTSFAPPAPIAGVNKLAYANTNAWFNGSANSRVNEAGATLNNNSYDWDLDGDGTFETLNQPRPTIMYSSNGEYEVTLRLTDSNNQSATDSIRVTVTGAVTELHYLTPGIGVQGQTVPVVLNGKNLKHLTSASMVSVFGGGVTVTGTPNPNALGTVVTGLSFDIALGASLGQREVMVSNADGEYSDFLFIINAGCAADFNHVNGVTVQDIFDFLTAWLAGSPSANFNGVNGVTVQDIFDFLTAWLAGC